METAQQSTLNKHSHFHMAVFLTLYVILDTAIKALLLQVSGVLLPEWMLGGTVYINVWNRHLIAIPTPIPITTIPTLIPIPITTIPTPIPTPPKRTTKWFRLQFRLRNRSRNRRLIPTPESVGIAPGLFQILQASNSGIKFRQTRAIPPIIPAPHYASTQVWIWLVLL